MEPIELIDAGELKDRGDARVAELRRLVTDMGIPAEVLHVGSTAHGGGLTKGDVDALVRVDGELFDGARDAFTHRFDVAQPENWTTDFASFTDPSGELPLGVQVVRAGTDIDVQMRRQHALLARPQVRSAYDRVKRDAAPQGPAAYWQAKDAFWSWLASTAGASD